MEKNIKENAGFYALGIIAIVIATLGITANIIYTHSGGYALGAGLVAVAFLFECFIYAISPKIAKTRAKGMLFFTASILTIYTILFIFGDLAKIKVYRSVYENGVYSSKLQPFGVFALVFEIVCLILTVFFVSRMVLNLFGKEIKFYEKILGTGIVRYKERENIEIDLPQKDTDKLIASAKRGLGGDESVAKSIENASVEDGFSTNKTPLIRESDEGKRKRSQSKRLETNSESSNKNEKKDICELDADIGESNYEDFSYDDDELSSAENFFSKNYIDREGVITFGGEYSEEDNVQHDDLNTLSTDDEKKNIDEKVVSQESELSNENVIIDENDVTVDELVIKEETLNVNQEPVENEVVDGVSSGDVNDAGELYADSNELGGVLSEFEIHDDIRKEGVSNHITEQVENPDDDIYGMFDYDSDDE